MHWQAAVKLICRGCLRWSAAAPAAVVRIRLEARIVAHTSASTIFWRLAPRLILVETPRPCSMASIMNEQK
jgi:uncharacterized membrane protein